jgi:hypothetical protein
MDKENVEFIINGIFLVIKNMIFPLAAGCVNMVDIK